MSSISNLPTPSLILDLDVLERNLLTMSERSRASEVSLRPHSKTHKCVEVARMQRDLGAKGLTVATLEEARFFASHGFDDLLWAFPVIPSRVSEALELASELTLRLVVDSPEAVAALEATGAELEVWIKVDCGYHRAGVAWDGPRLRELASAIREAPALRLGGILSHAGHSYACRGEAQLRALADEERARLVTARDSLEAQGHPRFEVSLGSTPTLSFPRDLTGVTEIRPGNYCFYDYSQTVIGSCEVTDCAITVLSTVISCQPGADHAVLDAGALTLSKERAPEGAPIPGYGPLLAPDGRPRDDARVVTLTQEHGIVDAALTVGERVRLLPNHSCLTVACHDEYVVVRGDEVVDRWAVHRAR